MASKKKQTALKRNTSHSVEGHEQNFKKSKIKTRHITKRAPSVDRNSSDDDEEDVLEMERNFVLLSKKSSMQAPQEEIRGGVHEKEEAAEDDVNAEDFDEDVTEERYQEGCSDMSGSGEDSDDVEAIGRPAGGPGTSEESRTNVDFKNELSTMSFEEVMQLQNKMGIKAYKKITDGAVKTKHTRDLVKQQLNKHGPQEISAKKPVPFLRKVVPAKKPIVRDPRFDDLSGEFKTEVFDQTYKFIHEIRQRETEMVKKKLKKVKSDAKSEELKYLLQRMENQERSRQRQQQQREKELQFKRKQRELVEQGHRPFYLKKSDKKKLELAEKYNQLKKSGKLENFLSKKRKRNAIKDRRRMPYQKNS